MNKKTIPAKITKPQLKVRDLPPKKNPKGGTRSDALTLNHNETFLCDRAV
jgi:hypothetical protein